MPEIAEVRTVARTLNKSIVGHKIIGLDIIYDKIIEKSDIDFFNVVGKKILKVDNYGKYIFINLGEYTIISHLRMEGKYFIKNRSDVLERHEHIIFHLDNNIDLRYHDTRKFGRMLLVKTDLVKSTECIKKLGIEPDSKSLTKEYLYASFKDKNIPIKTLLLDQAIIAGLGNIYANEVLYASNLNPNRFGSSLSIEECDNIRKSSNKIISMATKYGGSTIRSYTSSLGVTGHYQDYLLVHMKKNCSKCGSSIEKCRIGGRTAYYCPNCQK